MFHFLTRRTALRDTGTLIFAALLWTPALSPAAADPGKDSTAQAVSYMKANGFSAETIQAVLALPKFIADKKASGGVPPNEEVTITPVPPLKPTGTGLERMINGGAKLPKKSFFEVTQQETFTADNYAKVVEALFDPTDMDLWLVNPDGSAMNSKDRADQKDALIGNKTRWLAKLSELVSSGKSDVVARWFGYFNMFAARPIHGSREEFRRGLIASNLMAVYPSLALDRQKAMSSPTATEATVYVRMSNPTAQVIKIERVVQNEGEKPTTYEYFLASDESLRKVGCSDCIGANIFALGQWNAQQVKTYDLQVRGTAANLRLGAANARAAEVDARAAEVDAKGIVIREFLKLLRRTNGLAKTIQDQFDQLRAKRGDREFMRSLKANMTKWKALKIDVDRFIVSEGAKKYLDQDNRDTITELLNKILLNAKLNSIGD